MHNVNHTIVASAVKAAFELGVATDLKAMASKPYKFGTFAEQDYQILGSLAWNGMSDFVSLMSGTTYEPVADAPKDGSKDDPVNKTLMSDKDEVERLDLVRMAKLYIACVYREIESVSERARKDLEEAGKTTKDGGRFRFRRESVRGFEGYIKEPSEWIIDRLAEATPGTLWHCKLLDAQEEITSLPLVDITQANAFVSELFKDEDMPNELSNKHWAKVMNTLDIYGKAITAYEAAQAKYNAAPDIETVFRGRKVKSKNEAVQAEFANAGKEFRRATQDAKYWYERFIKAQALLCVTGAPAYLIKSPFWLAAEAKVQALEAEAEAAQADALAQAAMAKTARVGAQMKLMDALELQDQAEQELAEMRAAMAARRAAREARLNPPAPQPAPQPQVEQPQVEPDKPVPASLMPHVINQYGAAGFKH